MKRKSLILVLVALFCLFFVGVNKVSAAEFTYKKVESAADLTVGSTYVITNGNNIAMSESSKGDGSSSDFRKQADFDMTKSLEEQTSIAPVVLEEGCSSGAYHLKVGSMYLSAQDGNNLNTYSLKDETKFDWNITFSNGVINVVSVDYSERRIQYNSSSTRFAAYKGTQAEITLYKYVVGGGETPEPEQPDTPVVPEQTNQVEKVNELFKEYHNEGTYVKNTTIHLNSAAVGELATHFHVENHLVRTTYYTPEALWMSQGAEGEGVAYSYYGSAANNGGVTYGVAQNALEAPETTNVVLSGAGKESMEAYYTTLADLKSNTAVWVEDGNGYSTTDTTILGWFLDFTAPCLYGSVITANYFSYAKASVEEENDELVLKLWVTSENWGYIEGGVAGVNNVLSTAVISYEKSVVTSIDEAIAAADGTAVELTGTVKSIDTAWSTTHNNMSVTIVDDEGNTLYVYRLGTQVVLGDIIVVTGTMGTYNNERQVAQGATAVIKGHDNSYDYTEMTIVEAIAAADGTSIIVTGTVVKIDTAYNSSYNNISVYIADDNGTQLYVYRLTGEVTVGQIIKIKGSMATYSGSRQITGGTFEAVGTHSCSSYTKATCKDPASCVVCGVAKDDVLAEHNYVEGACTVCGAVDPNYEGEVKEVVTETSNIYANKGTLSNKIITWTGTGFTLAVAQGSNNNAIRTSDSDHFRIYQGNNVTLTCAGLKKVVFTCTSASYATVLKNSITNSNVEVTVSGSTVTVTVKTGTLGSLTFTTTAQTRINKISVSYEK